MALPRNDDTIAAIATLTGESSVGIVRMSGPQAINIAGRVFRAAGRTKLADCASHTVHYGWIAEGDGGSRKIIDEVLVTVMRGPRSYTREDVVEIGCHGGLSAVRRVLDVLLSQGARPAEAGEFTRRAFLNGRIDLTQAEAVLDVIKAKTDVALKAGMEHLRGGFSKQIKGLREELLDITALLEAHIDFSEEDIGALDTKAVGEKVARVRERIRKLIHDARYGRLLRDGVQVVICGRPKVGKSSLLNALVRQERSIVTAIAGTTRDTVE